MNRNPDPPPTFGSIPPITTEWTNEAVFLVLRGERKLERTDMYPFGVDEQGMTGGPVLRGPWGSVGGMQRDWARYEAEADRLNKAFLQGFMRGMFKSCQLRGYCEARQRQNYCMLCGATVVADHRIPEHRP